MSGIDARQAAELMLEWEELSRKIAEIEQRIRQYVLENEKTLVVGNVRATYSSGRRTFNYQEAVLNAGYSPESDEVKQFERVTVSIDWAGACKTLNITNIPFTQGEPSVSIKLDK